MAETRPDDLALLALLHACDGLLDDERAAFEERLAHDQTAREALAEAVRLANGLKGTPSRPTPGYREQVRQRLRPAWWRRLLSRDHYPGHPLLWGLTGAAAALLVSWTLLRPGPEIRVVEREAPATPAQPVEEAPGLQDMALIWAELHNADHATRAASDEQRRRCRFEERRPVRKAAQSPDIH